MNNDFKNNLMDWLWAVFAIAFIVLVGVGVL